MRVKSLFAAWAAMALFLLMGCILGNRQAGRGSEVENEVVGALVTDGGIPVAGAKVTALPSNGLQAKDAAKPESVFTDSSGRYRLADLAAGDYNLLGDFDHGKLVVLIPGVQRTQDAQRLDLGVDTLRAPGGIRARIQLNGEGQVGVLCYIPGTSNIAVSDDSGLCSLDKVPQGTYTVRYSLPGFLVDPDTGVKVFSGRVNELGPKSLAYDPELPPPAPKSLRIGYDFRAGTITLTWPPVPVSDLDGYVIYMDQPGKVEPQPRSTSIVHDTTFTDTVIAPTGTIRQVVYRVKARDKNADLSVSYSPGGERGGAAGGPVYAEAGLAQLQGDARQRGGRRYLNLDLGIRGGRARREIHFVVCRQGHPG